MSDHLNATPPCGNCGGTLVEHYGPTEEGCWWYHCTACGWEYGNNAELLSPLTMRTAPWTAPVVAAVLAVLDERIAVRGALEIDARWALKAFRQEVSGE